MPPYLGDEEKLFDDELYKHEEIGTGLVSQYDQEKYHPKSPFTIYQPKSEKQSESVKAAAESTKLLEGGSIKEI